MSEMVVQFAPTIALVSGGTGLPTTDSNGTATLPPADFQATLTVRTPARRSNGTITFHIPARRPLETCSGVTNWMPIKQTAQSRGILRPTMCRILGTHFPDLVLLVGGEVQRWYR